MFHDHEKPVSRERASNDHDLAIARALLTILEYAVAIEDIASVADIADQLANHARTMSERRQVSRTPK
jgi:hypothetical protein